MVRRTCFLFLAGVIATAAHAATVPMEPKAWMIDDKQTPAAGDFEEHLGRPSMHLHRGWAMLQGANFQNGSVEADVIPEKPGQGFVGLAFRMQSTKTCELIYIRNGQSGNPQAVQYDPVFGGRSTWQLHPGLQASAELPQDRWVHLKVVFNGPHAELFVDHGDKPVLTVQNLEHGDSRGNIGLLGTIGGGYISNVEYTQAPDAPYVAQPGAMDPHALTEWSLSQEFSGIDVQPRNFPKLKNLQWEKVVTDAPGLLMIDRYRESQDYFVADPRKMDGDGLPNAALVFAKTTIHSGKDVRRQLRFGYSDELMMYLNGQPVFEGKNGIGYRESGALGRLGMTESVYLPLKKGDNELVFAVKEYNGGWGFQTSLQ